MYVGVCREVHILNGLIQARTLKVEAFEIADLELLTRGLASDDLSAAVGDTTIGALGSCSGRASRRLRLRAEFCSRATLLKHALAQIEQYQSHEQPAISVRWRSRVWRSFENTDRMKKKKKICTNLTPNITAGKQWALTQQRKVRSSRHDRRSDYLRTTNRVLNVRRHRRRTRAQTYRLSSLQIIASHPPPSVVVERVDLVDRDTIRGRQFRAIITWLHIVSIARAVGVWLRRIVRQGAGGTADVLARGKGGTLIGLVVVLCKLCRRDAALRSETGACCQGM